MENINIDDTIKEIETKVDDILKRLEILEKEKEQIIQKYKTSDESEKNLITIAMVESEQKFSSLYNEILSISKRVKKLKKLK